MSLPTKLGIGTLALGSAVGAGYAGVSYFSKEDKKEELSNTVQQVTAISEIIKDKFDYILLNTEGSGDNSYWTTNWDKYKQDNSNNKLNEDTFKLTGWIEGDKRNLNLIPALKEKCKNLANVVVHDDGKALYDNVTKYCGREVTIADVTKELRVVNTSDTNDDQSIWQSREQQKSSLQTQLTTLGAIEPDLNAAKIKKQCKDAKTKKKIDGDYSVFYVAYEKVCLKQEGEQ